jgi:hypothetical protein
MSEKEMRFRRWVLSQMRDYFPVRYRDTIRFGAQVAGCSPAAARQYLAKLTSESGPLRVTHWVEGGGMLLFKDQGHPDIPPDFLRRGLS